jgi:DNA helicase-2/ATP-dependent DNA helicase PcrA
VNPSTVVYTPDQIEAINEIQDTLQLVACAGSGKTQVLAERIANILSQPGALPGHVIAFTFTDKAAAELKERIYSVVRERHGVILGLADMYVGTMHGYALNLLQTYVPEVFKYGVLTDVTQQLLIDRESSRSGLTTCTKTVNGVTSNLRRWIDTRNYKSALSILQEDRVDFSLIPDAVKESLSSYLELLNRRRYFDYTSMMVDAVEILERAETGTALETSEQSLRDHIQSDIKFVVVDEYQDVNPIQEQLIERLVFFGANLCVVGDDDQTIYQWRGSEVSNILTFDRRYAGVQRIELADNFRSSEGIVRLGRSIAERIDSSERLPKAMIYASHQTWERGDMLALQFENSRSEAEWIAGRIEALRGMPFVDAPGKPERGLDWSDCAVLYRSVKDADSLVDELKRRGIPFIVKGLARLFDADEIRACVGLIEYVVGNIDEVELHALWENADLIPLPDKFDAAVAVLREAQDFEGGRRHGFYNIQRLYLKVLEQLDLREDTVPGVGGRGELVMYQLGKFSQVISDFEEIHFSSKPQSKYESFLGFLVNRAPDVYEDADSDSGYATPNAVTITTVHRSKGLQWPAVFIPFMRRNRFPMKAPGGTQTIPHIVPLEAVQNGARYRGGTSDETRLFYVAVTRAEKYLYVTFAPGESSMYRNASALYLHCTASTWISTSDEGLPTVGHLTPTPKIDAPKISISFSELKYLIECPYQFKLRFLYGFNPPIHEALGYGRGLHDALAEMHKRALAGDVPTKSETEELVDRHLHTPYAYEALQIQLRDAAIKAIDRYFDRHGDDLTRTIHSEKQVEVQVSDGVVVSGRIDLIKSLETGEIAIVDFKSTDESQAEQITRDQLAVYALGYRDLTGSSADRIQILNLDADGHSVNEPINDELLDGIKEKVDEVAVHIRANDFVCIHDHVTDASSNDLGWLMKSGHAT